MKMIYERAEQALAWIGSAAHDSDQALELMDLIFDADTPDDYITRYIRSHDPVKVRGTLALAKLLDRPYWRRVWIRQELTVAKEVVVMCGDRLITWTIFESACDMLPTDLLDQVVAKISVYPSGYHDVVDIDSQREQIQADGHVSFEAMLLHAKSCEATDPRDRVYAILNLAPPTVTDRLKPDYTLDKGTVYREATIAELETSGSLGILSACEDPGRVSGLPSWVPNLEADWKTNSIKRRMEALQGIRLYNADGGRQAEPSLSPCRTRLTLRGVAIDPIATLGGVWNGDLETAKATVRYWQDTAMAALSRSSILWAAFEAFWRTMIADEEVEVCRMNFVSTFALSVALHIDERGGDAVPRLNMQPVEYPDDEVSPYLEMFVNTMTDRQVFITAGGRIGIGNEAVRMGDVVCVLLGGSMPFAVREQDDGSHAVVNEVYVHGIMDGEGMSSGSVGQEFVLR